MKSTLRLLVAAVLAGAVSLQASSIIRPTGKPTLRAGAAAVDITPRQFPFNMPGGFEAKMAEGAHDPLHARAIVLSDDKTTLALVVVDNLHAAREAADEAKLRASQQCGIPTNRILVCSTHSHTTPSSNSTNGPAAAVAYREVFISGLAEAIVKAHAALRPAAVGAGAAPLAEEVFNRRWYLKPGAMPLNPFGKLDEVKMNPGTNPEILDHPAGPTDPDISVLDVWDSKARKPLALFASYSLHYVGGMPKGLVSADYYGEFARIMPSRVGSPPGFVAMMANGTSGDVNNTPFMVDRPPREPFEQIRIVAQKAADTAWRARKNIKGYAADARLGMMQREITLKKRVPTEEQLEYAKKVLATKKAERDKLPRHAESYARNVLSRQKLEGSAAIVSAPLQAIRIGDLAICAIPFETFAEIGLDIKKRSPFARTIVIGLANASFGYLPTPEQHRRGGYETWLGTNQVQEDASVIITDNLLEMLAELKKEG